MDLAMFLFASANDKLFHSFISLNIKEHSLTAELQKGIKRRS